MDELAVAATAIVTGILVVLVVALPWRRAAFGQARPGPAGDP